VVVQVAVDHLVDPLVVLLVFLEQQILVAAAVEQPLADLL
jgi:hypothetical protein